MTTPERKFVRELTDTKNASHIDAWIKNAAMKFYSLEYAWKVSANFGASVKWQWNRRYVALANKNARIVWALLARGREFRSDYAAA